MLEVLLEVEEEAKDDEEGVASMEGCWGTEVERARVAGVIATRLKLELLSFFSWTISTTA
jgi:hypothetical protein